MPGDERFRVELWKDSDGLSAKLPPTPFDTLHAPPSDSVVQLGDEVIRFPALFDTHEEAKALTDKVGLPDGFCYLIAAGSWGPGVTFEEMEEDEMTVEDALDLSEWDAYQVVEVIRKEL